MVVMIDEGFDLGFEIARQEVVLEQDAVFQGLVPTLDFFVEMLRYSRVPHFEHGKGGTCDS